MLTTDASIYSDLTASLALGQHLEGFRLYSCVLVTPAAVHWDGFSNIRVSTSIISRKIFSSYITWTLPLTPWNVSLVRLGSICIVKRLWNVIIENCKCLVDILAGANIGKACSISFSASAGHTPVPNTMYYRYNKVFFLKGTQKRHPIGMRCDFAKKNVKHNHQSIKIIYAMKCFHTNVIIYVVIIDIYIKLLTLALNVDIFHSNSAIYHFLDWISDTIKCLNCWYNWYNLALNCLHN